LKSAKAAIYASLFVLRQLYIKAEPATKKAMITSQSLTKNAMAAEPAISFAPIAALQLSKTQVQQDKD